ncbi:MAG: SRPBCC family protein [Aggregatilineales bacterium]
MAVIDQRILIAAPVELIWLYLTEPAHVSRWHRGAKQLMVLTTRPGGVGARWRCVDTHGHSIVEEMTAWIEPVGYEYRVVDGPYRELTGRLRVQAVPDGTQVQWTVDYRLRGALGGLRDQFGHRRSLRNQLADSLRGLRRLIEASGIRFDPNKHAKVAMQADPGIVARMARNTDSTRQTATMRPIAVNADDVPDLPTAPTAAVSPDPTPGFVAPLLTVMPTLPPRSTLDTVIPASPMADDKDDTKPRPPTGLREAVATIAPVRSLDQPPDTLPPRVVANAPTIPAEQAVEEKSSQLDKRDTGEMSIWDIFGLERPSQRSKAELEAVIASLQTPPPRPLLRAELPESQPAHPPVEQMAAPPRPLQMPAETANVHPPVALKAQIAVRRLTVPKASGLRATIHTRR